MGISQPQRGVHSLAAVLDQSVRILFSGVISVQSVAHITLVSFASAPCWVSRRRIDKQASIDNTARRLVSEIVRRHRRTCTEDRERRALDTTTSAA